MNYEKWELVLVPFTDLSQSKRRPGLIVSPNTYNQSQDVVIAYVTSEKTPEKRLGDYTVQKWQEAGLPKPSLVRMKFATIQKTMIIKKLGKLLQEDSDALEQNLVIFFTS
jgi:mRNA interferase MazF